MKTNPIILIMLIFLFNVPSLFSQDCEICKSALKQDIMSYEFNQETYLDYLNTIDESSFSSIQQGGGFNFTLPTYGIPINYGGTYNEFSQQRNALFQQYHYTKTQIQSKKVFTAKISADGYKSFDNCIKMCKGTTGLFSMVEESDSSTIILKIAYKAPAGVNTPLVINNSQIINATYNGHNYLIKDSTSILPGSELVLILARKNNLKVRGAINASLNGVMYPTDFKVNPYYIPKNDTITEVIRLSENDFCSTQTCKNYKNIISIKFIQAWIPAGADSDCPSGCLDADPKLHNISFGAWTNDQCDKSGNGWSVMWGSCTKGGGTQRKRCQWADVEIKYIVKH